MTDCADPSLGRLGSKIFGLAKRLGGEIYVASEAGATPLRSYALQSLIERCTPGFPALDNGYADAIHPFFQRFPATKAFLRPECIESRR
jgi:hypothetical protein